MFNLFSIDFFVVVLIELIGFSIGLWVYFDNFKTKINCYFVLMTLSILIWIIFGYVSRLENKNDYNLLLYQINLSVVCIFFIFSYFFSVYFPIQGKRNKILDLFIILVSLSLICLIVFTNLIIKDTEIKIWGVNFILGKYNILFYGMVYIVTFLVFYNLFKKYSILNLRDKLRVQYFLIGISIFAVFNIIFNVSVPILFKTFRYYWIGDYSTIILLAFTAYAIVKQQLFNVKIVLTSLLVSFFAILVFLDLLIFTESHLLQIFKVGGIVVFLYLGRSLIKSVLEEEKIMQKMKKLNDDLLDANNELKEMIKMKTNFLHIVSHQLRTPLTAMRGYISMWQEGDFDDYSPRKMAEVKKRITNNTERLNNLVNDMVVAMESEGGIKLNFEKVDIEKIIKNNIELLESNFEAKNLYLRYRKTEKYLPKIDGDAKYLSNAFMNLIDNAEKYTKKGGLKIKISREEDNIKLQFSDTGIGINLEDQKNLFHKFSRGAASSLINPNGSGLGLFIIKQIIREHHGKIEFISKGDGKGTTFIVILPVRKTILPNVEEKNIQSEPKDELKK